MEVRAKYLHMCLVWLHIFCMQFLLIAGVVCNYASFEMPSRIHTSPFPWLIDGLEYSSRGVINDRVKLKWSKWSTRRHWVRLAQRLLVHHKSQLMCIRIKPGSSWQELKRLPIERPYLYVVWLVVTLLHRWLGSGVLKGELTVEQNCGTVKSTCFSGEVKVSKKINVGDLSCVRK
jgi:hypothetical protein